MVVLTSKEKSNMSVADFYAGKSVFITGGTGFLGKVFIEKLLYSCPDIDKIYMLIREKKGQSIRERMTKIVADPLFNRLKDKRPGDLDKIVLVPGDITVPGLGISEENETILTDKVSVVIHSAATVKFNEPLATAWNINVEGTKMIMALSRRMKRIEVFIHISTAYTNTNRAVIDEVLYPPPADINEVHQHVKNGVTEEETEKILNGRPNTYTFTKALTEHLVAENQAYMPTIIVRPSIVGAIKDDPIRGWLSNWYGATGLTVFTAKGLNRVIHGHPNHIVIPAFLGDIGRRLLGKSPRYYKLQNLVAQTQEAVHFFTSHTWEIKSKRTRELFSSLSLTDQRMFPCDANRIGWTDYITDYSSGVLKLECWELEIWKSKYKSRFYSEMLVVYIEKLLHSCKKIDKIYLLVREKKKVDINKRIVHMLDNPMFVYISTAFTHTHKKVLVETIYPPPAKLEDVYKFIEEYGDDEQATLKFMKPLRGWLENWYGGTPFIMNISKGWLRIARGDYKNGLDLVPVDYTTNLSIIAAAKAKRTKDVLVFNSTTTADNPLSWSDIKNNFSKEIVRHGKNDLPYPDVLFVQSRTALVIATFFMQTIPAHVLDLWLKMTGKEPKYVKILHQVIQLRDAYDYFTINSWVMRSDRTRELHSSLSAEDREEFQCDPTQINWSEYLKDYSRGVLKYLKPRAM
ncbi:hypothetical protein SFRURICE_001711 [Spodoptera frugiperda]|nr:hypothetical protein SFRURICE_001711 [Spodoptera frugiperda]